MEYIFRDGIHYDLARTSTRHGKIKCPLCQIEVAVPESGTMEILPDCFRLKNLLDILAIKECNASRVTCRNCDTKSEEASYCFHCSKFWCKECLNAHNVLKENKEHGVLALKDFQDKDFEDVLKLLRPAFCLKDLHERKVLTFYCKECQLPACKNCVSLEHTKLDIVKKSCQTISSHIQELEKQCRLTESRSKILEEQIQQTVKSAISSLQQQERELITELENQAKETQEELMRDKANFQDQLTKMEKTVFQFNRLLERSTVPELVRAKTSMSELFQDFDKSQDVPSTLERKVPNNVFLKNQEQKLGRFGESETDLNQCPVEGFQEATAGLETQFDEITRNFLGEQYYCPGDHITAEIMSTQGEKVASETKIFDKNDGRYAVSFIPCEAEKHRVIVRINGEKLKESSLVRVKKKTIIQAGGIHWRKRY